MRRLLVTFSLLIALGGTAVADELPATDLSKKTDQQLSWLLSSFKQNGLGNACTEALPVFDEMARRSPANGAVLQGREVAQMYCAAESNDWARAASHLKDLETRYGRRDLYPLAFELAKRSNDGTGALARFRILFRNEQLAKMPPKAVFAGFEALRRAGMKDELGAFSLEVAKSDTFAALADDERTTFAIWALYSAAKAGDVQAVKVLLPFQSYPDTYISMLKWRDYEKAWPVIEENGGDHLVSVVNADITTTRARYEKNPKDSARFKDLATALYFGGHFVETEELVGGWRRSHDLANIEEDDAWAMNTEALALDALGRRTEADVIMDRLAAYDLDKISWVPSFAINRASRLVAEGRLDEGLAATKRARQATDKHGTPYAKMQVASVRTCALYGLGRGAEAAAELDYLRANGAEAIEAAAQGLLCAKLDGEAADLLSKAIDDKDLRYQALNSFPGPQFDLFMPVADIPSLGAFILAHPALREKALRFVRVIPDRFIPLGQLKRADLARN
jgi:hypothetical protein